MSLSVRAFLAHSLKAVFVPVHIFGISFFFFFFLWGRQPSVFCFCGGALDGVHFATLVACVFK